MKRSREDEADETPNGTFTKKEVDLLLREVIKQIHTESKRQKYASALEEEEEEQEEESKGFFLSRLFAPRGADPYKIVSEKFGHLILDGKIFTNKIPYDDLGVLTEIFFYIEYPNGISSSLLEKNFPVQIPHFYTYSIDLKDCTPSHLRLCFRICKSTKIRQLLDREELARTKPLPTVKANENSPKELLWYRLNQILTISDTQLPDLPKPSQQKLNSNVIGIFHKNIEPPVTNSDINSLSAVPFYVNSLFTPEQNQVKLRITLRIQSV